MKKKGLHYLGLVTMAVLLCGCTDGNKGKTVENEVNVTTPQEVASTAPTQEPEAVEVAKGTIEVITEFYSPELDREQTVRIYLPPDYAESEKQYPVMYMLDGQNLFSSTTATYQKEWQIDERLDALYEENRTEGIIVVGVDSSSSTRNADYNLYLNTYEGGGNGKAFEVCDFYANTLKNYVDTHYRTLPDREHTAIVGASYGAIVSVCASIRHPEIYGYTGMFSYCDNQDSAKMKSYLKKSMTAETLTDNRIFFYTAEYDFALQSTKSAFEIAQENGIKNIEYVFDNGQHDEYAWGRNYEKCLEFFGWIAEVK